MILKAWLTRKKICKALKTWVKPKRAKIDNVNKNDLLFYLKLDLKT